MAGGSERHDADTVIVCIRDVEVAIAIERDAVRAVEERLGSRAAIAGKAPLAPRRDDLYERAQLR